MMRVVGALIASVAVASVASQADEPQPRIVFNDNAQMLMETTSQSSRRAPIKILIAVDSEGPTGVDEYWARNRKPGDPQAFFLGQGACRVGVVETVAKADHRARMT